MTNQPRPPRRRRRRRTQFVLIGVLLALLINSLAYLHARAALVFVPDAPPMEAIFQQPLHRQLALIVTGLRIPRPQNRQSPADHFLPYETHQIALPHEEHLEAWYVPHPQPRAIAVMLMGYAGVKEGGLTPAAKLYQWGYSSLLVDMRGAGGSSRNDQTMGIREAEDVAAAVTYAQATWPDLPVMVYGVSMGGAAAVRAVALYEVRPAGLILEAVFDRLDSTTRHRFDAFGVPASPIAELLLFWGGVQTGTNPFQHNPVEYARAVDVPVLLLYGEDDPWITVRERAALAAAFRGPVTTTTFPGQGHGGPYVYADPERWDAAVRSFLDSIPLQ